MSRAGIACTALRFGAPRAAAAAGAAAGAAVLPPRTFVFAAAGVRASALPQRGTRRRLASRRRRRRCADIRDRSARRLGHELELQNPFDLARPERRRRRRIRAERPRPAGGIFSMMVAAGDIHRSRRGGGSRHRDFRRGILPPRPARSCA